MKRLYYLIMLASLLALLTVGCNSAGEETGINTYIEETTIIPQKNYIEETTVPPQKTIPPSPTYTIEISFPEGAPILNKQTILTCKVKTIIPLTDMNIEIKLPEFLEPVNGNLTWSGDVEAGDELTVINTDITATGIGNGTILVGYASPPDNQISRYVAAIYVSIFTESARWEKYPLWSEGHGPPAVHISGDPLIHTNMYMSLSHLPRLNEHAELLCTIIPRQDVTDVKAEIVLPEEVEFIDGSLEWQGDLITETPVHFLAKIEFTQTGDYCIDAGLWRWFNGEYSWKVTSSKCLTIGIYDSEYRSPTISPDEELPTPPPTWIDLPNSP